MHTKKLNHFLDSGDGIGRLMPQAAGVLAVRRALSATLPDHLLRSCAIANYKQGRIVVIAATSAVAARLRLLEPSVIEALGKFGLNVTGLNIEVQPGRRFETQVAERKALTLSRHAGEALADAGRRLPEGALKQVLQGLASKGR